jgi:hypothetical protein
MSLIISLVKMFFFRNIFFYEMVWNFPFNVQLYNYNQTSFMQGWEMNFFKKCKEWLPSPNTFIF